MIHFDTCFLIDLHREMLAAVRRGKQPVATFDLLIATAAILDDAPLVTRHVKGFSRVPALRVLGY